MVGKQLRVTEGKERGKLLSVDADLLIGRQAPEDEGRLGGDPKISRRHARVSRGANRQLAIEDLGSANGTFVNDERIDAPRTLEVGDVIRVGETVLQVTDGSGAVPEKPRPPARAPANEPDRKRSRAAPRTLGVGDVIGVGETVLQVTDGSGAVPEKPRPPARAPANE